MISNKQKYEKYKPKKFLGQNFLIDENIAKKIVNSANIKDNDIVIEIGPGQGILTKYLCEKTTNAVAVELDRTIYLKLKEEYKDRVEIIHKDFLKFDLAKVLPDESGKIKVIGNIPYNITTEILFRLFDNAGRIDSAILMMQKEVAMRLNAVPDTKDYGILAIQTQVHSVPKILFNVSPSSFFPKPKVESSIVKLEFLNRPQIIRDKIIFKNLVRQSFGQRRKTLRNSLKRFFENSGINPGEFDFDFGRRAENVTIEEFIELSNNISEKIKSA